VAQDLLPGGLAEEVPQVPAVTDLDRSGQRPPGSLAIGTRPVTAHDRDPGVRAQPLLSGVRGPARDDIDTPTRFHIDENSRVDEAAAEREVVDPQDPGDLERGKRDPEQDP
jgi:hypothetical protein